MYTVTFGQKSSKLNSRPVYCSRLYCTRILESILYMGFIRFSGMNFSYVRLVVKNYLETLSFPEDCFSSELTTLHSHVSMGAHLYCNSKERNRNRTQIHPLEIKKTFLFTRSFQVKNI